MILEVSAKKFEKLKEKLDEAGIQYQISNYSITNNTIQVYRFDFGAIDPELVKEISEIYTKVSDELYKNEQQKGHYERTWDKKYHTLGEEIVGQITGQNEQEEYVYEN